MRRPIRSGDDLTAQQLLARVDARDVRTPWRRRPRDAPHFGRVEPLLGDQRVIEVRRRAGGGQNPLALAVLGREGRDDRPEQLLLLQAPARQLALLLDFGHRRDAVIGGEGHDGVVEADKRVHPRQQLPDRPIDPHRHVAHVRAVGAEGVPDGVIRRKAHSQQVGDTALTELLGLDGCHGEVLQELVAKRAAVDRLVQLRSRRRRHHARRPGRGVEQLPLAPGVLVGRGGLVELRRPGMQLGPIVRARHEHALLDVEPVRGVGAMADRQDRGPILQRQPEDLRRALGRQVRGGVLHLVAQRAHQQPSRRRARALAANQLRARDPRRWSRWCRVRGRTSRCRRCRSPPESRRSASSNGPPP